MFNQKNRDRGRERPHALASNAGHAMMIEALEPRQVLAAVVFTGAGGDNLWSNPDNWSGGAVPATSDDVVIASATNAFNVVLDVNPTRVKSLFLNERLVVNRGVSLSVTGDIDLAPQADLRINGLVNWAAGQWESGAKSTINPGGVLNIGSTANPTQGSITIQNDLVNAGRLAWRGGAITLDGTITNNAAKAFDASSPMVMTGDGVFTNFGLFRKGGLATSTTTIDVDFNNDDRVYTLRGTLEIGRDDPNIPSNIDFGVWSTLNTNATVVMRSPTLHGSVKFTGVGQYQFVDFTHIFRGPTSFSGATFAADSPIFIDNRGATFFGSATVNGSAVELEGALAINGTLTLAGATVNGNFPLGVSGTLNASASTINTDVGITSSGKLASSGASFVNADLVNFGTVQVLTGVLDINVTGSNRSGLVQNAGTFIVSASGRINVRGDLDSTGVIETNISGSGAFGRVTVSGDMDLAGTLRARFTGAFPALSNFNILTAGGSRTGSFSTFTPLGVPAGKTAVPIYTPSGVTIRLS